MTKSQQNEKKKLTLGWTRVLTKDKNLFFRESHFILSDGHPACDILRDYYRTNDGGWNPVNEMELGDTEQVGWVCTPGENMTKEEELFVSAANSANYYSCKICQAAAKAHWTPEYAEQFVSDYHNFVERDKRKQELDAILGRVKHGNKIL